MRRRLRLYVGIRDPGRVRLFSAIAVSCGVVGCALITVFVEHVVHADPAFLAMAVFLSVQAGVVIMDTTRSARVLSALLLIPVVLLSAVVASLLSSSRTVEIVVFVALAGAAIWIQRYGPRAGGVGTLAFLAYFFTLFMRPTVGEMPVYCAIAVVAAATQAIARAVLELTRSPGREIALLFRELRIASADALEVADSLRDETGRRLDARLVRVDAVVHAIEQWQEGSSAETYVGCTDEHLSLVVADVSASLKALCDELARTARPRDADRLDHLIAQHQRAFRLLGDLVSGVGETTRPAGVRRRAPRRVRTQRAEAERSARGWRGWTPTGRLAVQAMIAATIAAAAGEAISATRWYWAVMTAFVIFLSTTTRSGILTRAYRRVIGSAIGIVCGVGAVLLAGILLGQDQQAGLVVICTVGVFGMLYWGPVSYAYSAFFVTVMLVAIYAMLGVLAAGLLELRLGETIVGAVVGVLCAYLILSANSRPALTAKVDGYFVALQNLIRAGASAFDSAGSRREDEVAVVAASHVLRESASDVDATVKAMSAAFLNGRLNQEADALVLMQRATRAAVEFAHEAMISAGRMAPDTAASARNELHAAADRACESAEAARLAIEGTAEPASGKPRRSVAPGVRTAGRPVELELALDQVDRVDSAMIRLVLVAETHERDRPRQWVADPSVTSER
ncbi:FUSC family protein [Leifsonia aquatica]|uniref:FUSC family protein n=1 Tax=Leifsonia aquatica TaxID=144185 RepID=UPI00384F6D4C